MAFTLASQRLIIISSIMLLLSCSTQSNKNERGVELAMKHYDGFIKKIDADSIAWLYTEDGNLGNVALGRDSIRNFLRSFKNIEVLSQSSITKNIIMMGDSAVQKGTYIQKAVISKKDTVTVSGEYVASWLWITNDGWHIKRMLTKPNQ